MEPGEAVRQGLTCVQGTYGLAIIDRDHPDTLAAIREAKRKRGRVYGVCNNVVGSSIARETDAGVYLHAGPEIGAASSSPSPPRGLGK